MPRSRAERGVIGTPGSFERPVDRVERRQQPWEMGDEDPVDVRVLVDADQAPWVANEVGEDAVEERRADGSVVVCLHVTSRPALRSLVLGLLDHGEVLDPPAVRAEVVDWLRKIAAA